MSTPPPATATGITQDVLKSRLEAAVLAGLNPGADPKGWKVSRFHYDDFTRDTDNQVALSFVVGIGVSRYMSDRQHDTRQTGEHKTYVSTEVRVRLATRNRAPNVRDDSTKHLDWAGAVLRAAMAASRDGIALIYRSTGASLSLQAGQVLTTEHLLDARHVLPLE